MVFFCALGSRPRASRPDARLAAGSWRQQLPLGDRGGLAVYHAAFVCEALRSGVNTIPEGQAEAARAIGLTFFQSLTDGPVAAGVPRRHRAAWATP